MSESPDLLQALQDSLEQGRQALCACNTDDWTCGVCGHLGSEHHECDECGKCPGYPHDYGCGEGQS